MQCSALQWNVKLIKILIMKKKVLISTNIFAFSINKVLICSRVLDITGTYTACPVNWYSLSISIPDFPDGPMKKKLTLQF